MTGFSATAALRRLDKDARRAEFCMRQASLLAIAVLWLAFAFLFDEPVMLAPAVLVIKTGAVEALRFRRAGTILQTKRSIWRGATPEDVRARALLHGWRPWQAR